MNTQDKSSSKGLATALLRIAAVLWVIWGVVHVLAGVLTIGNETPQAVMGIADAVNPATLEIVYPDAAGAIINQHGFNLSWIGVFTTVCAVCIWRRSTAAIFLAAIVGGLTDIGYFLFMDLGGHVNFVPGTLMTLICASAIAFSFFAHFRFKF
ncbi:hypothetical protein SV7mr_30660 [Stieleria bergensis]|uniref:Uncharacterized protein n=1 Tax=Stieleria bergensis TaxID=2528025 RepID=A0A517SWM6_9BACT|nr:hypothetical protein SV7mr_30660 [Planctomycetes bacterium SV_7m_r]